MTPEDRRYVKTHEWIKIEGDIAVVGITDYAQSELGDITFVELPEPGHPVEKGDECAVVESVKAASDIFAPLAGEITESNLDLDKRPEEINEDPYGEGWIFKMKDFDRDEYEHLMTASEYDHIAGDDEEEG